MLISIVIPVYNEEEVLPLLLKRLKPALKSLDYDHEIIFVNDGSSDGSLHVLNGMAAADRRLKILSFARNFGQEAAITAGLDFAAGDAVVVMDADLQDPPELLPEMVRHFEQGYEVVSAQRVSRKSDTWCRRRTVALFYWIMSKMVDKRIKSEVGDFRLLSRAAVRAIQSFREQHRFLRGLIAWLGLKEVLVPFHRGARAAGETKFALLAMVRFAWTAVVSFSALPLRICMAVGTLVSLASFSYLVYALYAALIVGNVGPGWTSLVVLQCFLFGLTLCSLGLIADYIGRIYDEAKRRPLYVVARVVNFDNRVSSRPRSVVLPPVEWAHDDGRDARVRPVR